MPYFYWDRTYLILLPAIIIAAYAQFKVSSTFNKYNQVRSYRGYTGEQVARTLLNNAGIFDVKIEMVQGNLTDHYDPRVKTVRLSKDVYYGTSLAAIGVAAHEIGHVQQHYEGYAALSFRNSMVPVVNFSNGASWILFILGIFMSVPILINIGIILFLAVVIFQVVTLPVEFNASSRAIRNISNMGILEGEEIKGAKAVLSAAALTYVAGALMAIAQLLRLLAISNRNSNR
ncbi:MAG: zinc metallopeptidase [Sarcina sp.]